MEIETGADFTTQDIISGRKTFFIVPDPSLLPETYLEDYMQRGYETYIIADDRYCPLEKKVESIISIFKDSILFFYIDAKVAGIDWQYYIRNLQERSNGELLIGVLYTKRATELEKQRLERYYLFDVGIQCGCIAMEYQKEKNFSLIAKVMYANQAQGRRKNIRAICDKSSKVNFDFDGGIFMGRLVDISLSHFSCIMTTDLKIPIYEKVENIYVDVNGLHFKSDGILLMERQTDGKIMYVFIFARHSDGGQGLDRDLRQRLAEKIYQMITDKVKMIMQLVFTEMGRGSTTDEKPSVFTPKDLRRLL
ncbi:MAG: hypothetical protein K6G80_05115 [Treponema sp.]|nr:hypothetical protein [Treponema sp.]